MEQFTQLYRNEKSISFFDAFVIIETNDNIEVQRLNKENIKQAIVSAPDKNTAELSRDYYAEKYRCFYALGKQETQKGT